MCLQRISLAGRALALPARGAASVHGYLVEPGRELELGIDTIRRHVRHVYEKLHVHSKCAALERRILP